MTDKKNKGTDPKTYKFDTLSLHAGYQPHKNAGSRQVPIYQTTSYLFDDVDHAAALFNLERGGHIYSRISNPTVAVLEERVASLRRWYSCFRYFFGNECNIFNSNDIM